MAADGALLHVTLVRAVRVLRMGRSEAVIAITGRLDEEQTRKAAPGRSVFRSKETFAEGSQNGIRQSVLFVLVDTNIAGFVPVPESSS